jgi:hypothetical protein
MSDRCGRGFEQRGGAFASAGARAFFLTMAHVTNAAAGREKSFRHNLGPGLSRTEITALARAWLFKKLDQQS